MKNYWLKSQYRKKCIYENLLHYYSNIVEIKDGKSIKRNKFLEDNKKRQYNIKNKGNMIRYVSMFSLCTWISCFQVRKSPETIVFRSLWKCPKILCMLLILEFQVSILQTENSSCFFFFSISLTIYIYCYIYFYLIYFYIFLHSSTYVYFYLYYSQYLM